jgi:hypothetical protein
MFPRAHCIFTLTELKIDMKTTCSSYTNCRLFCFNIQIITSKINDANTLNYALEQI